MARRSPEQKQRAGDAAAIRRGELGYTQKELAEKASIGVDRIVALENGHEWPQTRNRNRIEVALRWQTGALDRMARGGNPRVEAIDADAPEPEQTPEEKLDAAQRMLDEVRELMRARDEGEADKGRRSA